MLYNKEYVQAQPVQAQPVQAQPVQAQPVRAQPVHAQPVHAQPAYYGANAPQPPVIVYAQPVRGTPVLARPVPSQQPAAQVVFVGAPQVLVAGGCYCGGHGVIESRNLSALQLLMFVILLIAFWPIAWLP
jgi:hypothetical protein